MGVTWWLQAGYRAVTQIFSNFKPDLTTCLYNADLHAAKGVLVSCGINLNSNMG